MDPADSAAGTAGDNTEGTTPPAGGAPAAASSRVYTEDEVRRIESRAWAEARRKYDRQQQQPTQQQTEQQPKQQGQTQDSDWQSELRALRLERAFDDALPEGVTLTKQQKAVMRNVFVTLQPDDHAEWVDRFLDTFGLRGTKEQSRPSAETAATPSATPPVPTGPPVSDAGPPAAPRDLTRLKSVKELTAEDRTRIYEQHGPVKGAKMIRDMLTQSIRR